MSNHPSLVDQITDSVASTSYLKILKPLEIGKEGWQNELLLFMKPELFMPAEPQYVRNSVALIVDKLAEFDAQIHGVVLVGGQFLADYDIMDRHYGYINNLSKNASKLVTPAERAEIAELLGIKSWKGIDLFGGHEYLKKFPEDTIKQLDRLWFSFLSIKLRSGFYIQLYEAHGRRFVLVNGFHPGQLNHFTAPDHRVVLFLAHSNTPWKVLRNEMVGNTYPERARFTSIRGALFADPSSFGLTRADISANGVHLSAGPFEGVFEISNFFNGLYPDEATRPLPLLVKRLVARGLTPSEALKVIENPPVTVGEKVTSLFSATEDFDTSQAVDFWLDQLKTKQ